VPHDQVLPRHAPLLDASLPEVMAAASSVRDRAHGTRTTYSPKVFIPLTHLCRDRCGYCTFAQPPARLRAPYLTPDEVLGIARAGAAAGCHEALFTLGERPELRYPEAAAWLEANGHATTVDHLVAMCRLVLEETGLLPHANAGALSADELAALRPVSPGQGMMLESLTPTAARPTRSRPAASPPSRRPAPWRSRSPPASSSGSASRGRTGSSPSRPSPTATRAAATCRR
jgi:FO synthase